MGRSASIKSAPQSGDEDAGGRASGSQTPVRGLDVIDALIDGLLNLQELSDRLGLTRSTTHRLASALVDRRLLSFRPREGYSLGPKLLELGHAAGQKMRQGADVAINAFRDAKGAAEVVAEVEALGRRAVAVDGDVALPESETVFIERAVAELGRMDVFVSNAGICPFHCTVALGRHGIRFISVLPGTVATDINKDDLADPKKREDMEGRIPLGRLGHPQDIASVVAFLASDMAGYKSGAALLIDGGAFANFQ